MTPGKPGRQQQRQPSLVVEAFYPALRFQQQLRSLAQECLALLHSLLVGSGGVDGELRRALAACACPEPRPSLATAELDEAGEAGAGLEQPWQRLVAALDGTLATLQQAAVPQALVRRLMHALLGDAAASLQNALLQCRCEGGGWGAPCCSVGGGQRLQAGVRELQRWHATAGEAWVSPAASMAVHACSTPSTLASTHRVIPAPIWRRSVHPARAGPSCPRPLPCWPTPTRSA